MHYRLLRSIKQGYPCDICVLSNDGGEQVYGCVPNGGIGISVITKGACYIKRGDAWEQQCSMFVYGLVKKVQWHKITPAYREITIVFKPHHLQALLRARLSDLPDHTAVCLSDLFDRDTVDALQNKLGGAQTDEAIVATVCSFLEEQCKSPVTHKVVAAAHSLICDKKVRKVEDLGNALNVSCTELRTIFRDKVGISPKELIKVRRINEAFRVKEHKESTLIGLAYRLDYFDQAHFIHDFKEVMGITPRQYFKNTRLTADFYNYGRWDHSSFEACNSSVTIC